MLASEILRRIVPSGTNLDVQALGALDVVGQASSAGVVSTAAVAITGDLNVTGSGHFTSALTMFNGARVVLGGVSATVDLLAAPGTQFALDFPVAAGKTIVGILGRVRWVTRTGTATGNAQFKIGNNGSHDNFLTAALGIISTANINAGATDVLLQLTGGINAVSMASTAMVVEIVTVPTGVSAASVQLVFSAVYV